MMGWTPPALYSHFNLMSPNARHTGVQKQSEAVLLRVRVDGVVRHMDGTVQIHR